MNDKVFKNNKKKFFLKLEMFQLLNVKSDSNDLVESRAGHMNQSQLLTELLKDEEAKTPHHHVDVSSATKQIYVFKSSSFSKQQA